MAVETVVEVVELAPVGSAEVAQQPILVVVVVMVVGCLHGRFWRFEGSG